MVATGSHTEPSRIRSLRKMQQFPVTDMERILFGPFQP
jgi:hypothetical protein